MKDVSSTLRRIDEEITGHKQRIAYSQVEITRLQDARQVLARLVEDDQRGEQLSKLERASIVNGAHAKPVLIVRQTGSGGEDGSASKAAKEGKSNRELGLHIGTMHAKTKRDYKIDSAKYGKRSKPSESADYRKKILETLAPDEVMTSREIGDYLGLPRNETDRKAMSNALYQLRIKGDLARDEENRYSLPR